jgi:hypothetical protein
MTFTLFSIISGEVKVNYDILNPTYRTRLSQNSPAAISDNNLNYYNLELKNQYNITYC